MSEFVCLCLFIVPNLEFPWVRREVWSRREMILALFALLRGRQSIPESAGSRVVPGLGLGFGIYFQNVGFGIHFLILGFRVRI